MGEYSLEEALSFDPTTNEDGIELVYTDDVASLILEINKQKDELNRKGFEAEFLLLNRRNYERLLTYIHHFFQSNANENGLIDNIFGMNVVLWDVPIDYVNVRAKASIEFAYEDALKKGK